MKARGLFRLVAGRKTGPYTPEQLLPLVADGRISRLDRFSYDGIDWLPADRFPELMRRPAPAMSTPSSPAPKSPPPRSSAPRSPAPSSPATSGVRQTARAAPPALEIVPPDLPAGPLMPGDAAGIPSLTSSSTRPRPARNNRIAVGIGGVSAILGTCAVIFTLFYNVYLQTDSAAIGLLKESMQETLEQEPSVMKPVKVLKVRLTGSGRNRGGEAVISFAGKGHHIAFTAVVTKSFSNGVSVEWETDEPLPASLAAVGREPQKQRVSGLPSKTTDRSTTTDSPGTDKPGTDKPGTDKPDNDPGYDKPGKDFPPTDDLPDQRRLPADSDREWEKTTQDPSRFAETRAAEPVEEREFRRHLGAYMAAAAAMTTSENLLLSADAESGMDETSVNRELDKLLGAWNVVADEAEWLLDAVRQRAAADEPSEEVLQLSRQLAMIVTIHPAAQAALRGARATSDQREYAAHMQTYVGLTERFNARPTPVNQ